MSTHIKVKDHCWSFNYAMIFQFWWGAEKVSSSTNFSLQFSNMWWLNFWSVPNCNKTSVRPWFSISSFTTHILLVKYSSETPRSSLNHNHNGSQQPQPQRQPRTAPPPNVITNGPKNHQWSQTTPYRNADDRRGIWRWKLGVREERQEQRARNSPALQNTPQTQRILVIRKRSGKLVIKTERKIARVLLSSVKNKKWVNCWTFHDICLHFSL